MDQELDDADAWRQGDGLLVFLTDTAGASLGFLSMDAPLTGRRPSEDEVRLIRAVALHAEQALESAQHTAHTRESERINSRLLEASPPSPPARPRATCCGRPATRWFPSWASSGSPPMCAASRAPWHSRTRAAGSRRQGCHERWRQSGWMSCWRPREHAGCWLIDACELFAEPAPAPRSQRNGRGPGAWNDSCLVLPSRCADGSLRVLFAIEDPTDRLLPTDARRRALRLLVEQLSAVQSTLDYRDLLQHLATHDPLTGLRNGRHLTELISEYADVALLVCDLDHFKRVTIATATRSAIPCWHASASCCASWRATATCPSGWAARSSA